MVRGRRIARGALVGLGIVLTAIIVSAGYLYYTGNGPSNLTTPGQANDDSALPQATARIGNLTVTTSGSGKLIPAAIAELGFQESGQVMEMNVKIGEAIEAGQVLARLQKDKTTAEHAAEIASAELAVLQAQQELEQIYDQAQTAAAEALAAVEEAERALEDLNDFELEQALAVQAVAEAEAAKEDAELVLSILNASPSSNAIYTAYASLLFKEKELQELQDQIERTEYKIRAAPNSDVRDGLKQQLLSLRARLAQQQVEVEAARYKCESMDDPPEPIEVSVAEAQLASAQAQLVQAQQSQKQAQLGATMAEIAKAEASLEQAQAEWEQLKDGPDADEIAIGEARVVEAQARLALLEQESLIIDLVAPFDGTVKSISAAEGDRITDQAIVTLIDSSQPSVEVHLDETDLADVEVGHPAEIVFEALPGENFSGRVVAVDPSLAQVGGSYAVRAVVQLDAMPDGTPLGLPMGLAASVDITAGQVDTAVLVPVEALEAVDNDSHVVYVIQGEEIERRPVTIGLRDLTSVEILSGLDPGEAVAIGDLEALEGMP